MRRTDEKGVALILVMIMLAVLSVIAVSLMSVARSETYASMNYRLMSSSRYGGESAVHRASNYLMHGYAPPPGGSDPLSNYDMTKSPVEYNGRPVVLSNDPLTASNYPVAVKITAYQTALGGASGGTLAGGSSTVIIRAVATLTSMRPLSIFGGQTAVVQTWAIRGIGALRLAGRPAMVEVASVLERQVQPTFRYAAFAVDTGCKALWWTGNGYVDSYDSVAALNPLTGTPVQSPSGGNVGTNGNLTVANNSIINGTLSVPPLEVCQCADGQYTGPVTATAGTVRLPQTVEYPTPDPPTPMPGTGNEMINSNADFNPPTLDENGNLVGATHADVKVQAGVTLTLHAGTYNMNSLALAGGATLVIAGTGNVVINLAGQGFNDNQSVLDIAGNTISTGSFTPDRLQIIYAGTATVGLSGSGETSALLYAPNATVNLNANGGHWYGAVIGKTIKDASAALHYDRSLQRKMMTLGAWMFDSFTWKKQ